MLLSMLEGPPQSNRTPTIAERAIFGILKSCRNRGSHFLQSTGLWLNCGKSTTLLQFRPIGFDCVEIAPNRRRCEAIRQNCKPNLPNWDILQTAIPSITLGLYETFNPSTILADSKWFWRIPRDYSSIVENLKSCCDWDKLHSIQKFCLLTPQTLAK